MKRNRGLDRAAAVSKILDCLRGDALMRKAIAPVVEKELVNGFKLHSKCRECDHNLYLFESQRAGIGPVCAQRVGK